MYPIGVRREMAVCMGLSKTTARVALDASHVQQLHDKTEQMKTLGGKGSCRVTAACHAIHAHQRVHDIGSCKYELRAQCRSLGQHQDTHPACIAHHPKQQCRTIRAEPATVCAASASAASRGKPAATPPSASASMSRKT